MNYSVDYSEKNIVIVRSRSASFAGHEVAASQIAFAITSKKPKASYPLVFELPEKLLPKPSWVKTTQIRTLSAERIGSFIASVKDEHFEQIMSGFNRLCGFR